MNSQKINIQTLVAFTCININNKQSKNTKEGKTLFTKRNKILRNKFGKKCARTMKEILKNITKETTMST